LDKIVDVSMGTTDSVHHAAELGQQKSPLKGNLRQVVGVIAKPLNGSTIVIRTKSTPMKLDRSSASASQSYLAANPLPCSLTTNTWWQMSRSTGHKKAARPTGEQYHVPSIRSSATY
jgi:hypothetical protein